MHQRTVIRDKAKALLLGKTLAGAHVYCSRVKPFSHRKLPAIGIYFNGGQADDGGRNPRRYVRTEDLVVEIVAAELADERVDELLDGLAEQVENIFLADETLDDTAWDCVLSDTDLRPTRAGDREFGSARIIFRVTYETVPPEGLSNDLDVVAADWDLGPVPDGQLEAQDQINLEEE